MNKIFITVTLAYTFSLWASGETQAAEKWPLLNSAPLLMQPSKTISDTSICSLISLDDGKSLIAASSNGLVQRWFNNFSVFKSFFTEKNLLNLQRSKDNLYIFLYQSGIILLRSLGIHKTSKAEQLNLLEKDIPITCTYSIDSSSSFLITGNIQGIVDVWDLTSKKVTESYAPHTAPITALCLTNNYYIISASEDKTLKIWDMQKKTTLRTFSLLQPVLTLHALAKGFLVVFETEIELWDDITQDAPTKKFAVSSAITCVCASKNSFAVGSSDGTITLFDYQKATDSLTLTGSTSAVTALTWLTPTCLISGSETGETYMWQQQGNVWKLIQKLMDSHEVQIKGQKPPKKRKGSIYHCAECNNQEFFGLGKYTMHRARMHNEGELMKCDYCNYKTRVRLDLRNHVQKKHAENFSTFLETYTLQNQKKKGKWLPAYSNSSSQSNINHREEEVSIISLDDEPSNLSANYSFSSTSLSTLLQERAERLCSLNTTLTDLETKYRLLELRITQLL